jgi:hypothetical protein
MRLSDFQRRLLLVLAGRAEWMNTDDLLAELGLNPLDFERVWGEPGPAGGTPSAVVNDIALRPDA